MTKFSPIDVDRKSPSRRLGFGRLPNLDSISSNERAPRFIGALKDALNSNAYAFPSIETVRIHYNGPLADAAVTSAFGAQINPFSSSASTPPAGADSVESSMVEPGKFQTYVLIVGIGWHLEPEPLCATVKVNALTTPSVGTAMPISPDAFSQADIGVGGPLGLTTGQKMFPGVINYGGWAERAFYYMVRAYNLYWQWGQTATIVNDSLRYTAFTPSSGQDGSASSSEIETDTIIRETGDYYTNVLNSPYIPIPIDRTRVGNMTLAGSPGCSVFRPTRAYRTVGATYGGIGLGGSLRKNSEFRKLTTPFLLRPGVPMGLRAQVVNSSDQLKMQQWLAASHLLNGVIPADFSANKNINVGPGVTAGSQTGMEPSLDNPVLPQPITTVSDEFIFKGGGFKMTMALKGLELSDDQAAMLQNSSFRDALTSECGCQVCY